MGAELALVVKEGPDRGQFMGRDNMKFLLHLLSIILLITAGSACGDQDQSGADNVDATLYYGGDILTMEGDEAQYVEAVVVEAGKIAFVGSRAEAEKEFAYAQKLDLAGRTLLPGFIDAHGHVWITGFQAPFCEFIGST